MSAATATLGARIKARREELQLSLRGLADATGGAVSNATISQIETGATPNPGLDKLRALAGALGWTLDELDGKAASGVRSIALKDLWPDPNNPRVLQEGDAADAAFVQSIKDVGLIQPLAVRRHPDGGSPAPWMVVDGHRRYAALIQIHGPRSKVAVPCRIVEGDDKQTLLMQLVANVQRADMNPWDLAKAIGNLVAQEMDTQAIADALGRKRRWVQEMASVGRKAANGTQNALMTGRISISQAIAIVAAKDEAAQSGLVHRASDGKLNEDEIRAIIADAKAQEKETANRQQADIADIAGVEDKREEPVPATPLLTWNSGRGSCQVRVFRFPTGNQYSHCGKENWRTKGGVEWHWSAVLDSNMRLKTWHTIHEALHAAVLHGLNHLTMTAIKDDLPSLEAYVRWAKRQLVKHGMSEEVASAKCDMLAINLRAKLDPLPVPPSAPAPAPTPEQPPAAIALSVEEIMTPPKWGSPLAAAQFAVVGMQRAYLCEGWAAMAQQVIRKHPGDAEDLHFRDAWDGDADGLPYTMGDIVFVLHKAPQ